MSVRTAFWRHFGALGVSLGRTLAPIAMQNHIMTLHKNMVSGTADLQIRGSCALQNGDENYHKQQAQQASARQGIACPGLGPHASDRCLPYEGTARIVGECLFYHVKSDVSAAEPGHG